MIYGNSFFMIRATADQTIAPVVCACMNSVGTAVAVTFFFLASNYLHPSKVTSIFIGLIAIPPAVIILSK